MLPSSQGWRYYLFKVLAYLALAQHRVWIQYELVIDEISKRNIDNGKLNLEVQFLGASDSMLMSCLAQSNSNGNYSVREPSPCTWVTSHPCRPVVPQPPLLQRRGRAGCHWTSGPQGDWAGGGVIVHLMKWGVWTRWCIKALPGGEIRDLAEAQPKEVIHPKSYS